MFKQHPATAIRSFIIDQETLIERPRTCSLRHTLKVVQGSRCGMISRGDQQSKLERPRPNPTRTIRRHKRGPRRVGNFISRWRRLLRRQRVSIRLRNPGWHLLSPRHGIPRNHPCRTGYESRIPLQASDRGRSGAERLPGEVTGQVRATPRK